MWDGAWNSAAPWACWYYCSVNPALSSKASVTMEAQKVIVMARGTATDRHRVGGIECGLSNIIRGRLAKWNQMCYSATYWKMKDLSFLICWIVRIWQKGVGYFRNPQPPVLVHSLLGGEQWMWAVGKRVKLHLYLQLQENKFIDAALWWAIQLFHYISQRNNNRNKVHNKQNPLESSSNHPTPLCPWKNCFPGNWSLVPKRLGISTLSQIS